MPRVSNSGTVISTDGVTLQGNGSAASPVAIKAVQVDGATITGAGTVASPLVAGAAIPIGWPLNWYSFGEAGLATAFALFGHTANTYTAWGIVLPVQLAVDTLILNIHLGDATHNCDAGLYNAAGHLVANIGAQHLTATGIQQFAIAQGAVTLNPGRYYFATTSVATTATLYTTNDGITPQSFYFAQDLGTTTGGALNATITPPAEAPAANGPIFSLSS